MVTALQGYTDHTEEQCLNSLAAAPAGTLDMCQHHRNASMHQRWKASVHNTPIRHYPLPSSDTTFDLYNLLNPGDDQPQLIYSIHIL